MAPEPLPARLTAPPAPAFTSRWVNAIYGEEWRRSDGGEMFYTGPFYGDAIPAAVRRDRVAAVLTYVPHAFAEHEAGSPKLPGTCRVCAFPMADAPCYTAPATLRTLGDRWPS